MKLQLGALRRLISEVLEDDLDDEINGLRENPEYMSLEAFIESKLDDDNYEYNFIDLHALGRNMTQAKYGSKMEVSEAGASDLAHIKKELGDLGFKFVGRNVTKSVRGFRAGAHGRNPFAGSGGGGTGMGSAWGNPTGFSHGGGPGAVGGGYNWSAGDSKNLKMGSKR